MVLKLTCGVGDDLEQLGDIGQVRVTGAGIAGVDALVGLADGSGLADDEPIQRSSAG